MAVNISASIRNRLLNLARERKESFDFILKQYLMQRILYRLSVSEYSDQFLLKGAMLFLIWTGDLHRPTKDIDLLGFGENDTEALLEKFRTICNLDVKDGLQFDSNEIQSAQIKEAELYKGVRITGIAYLDKAKINFQVDIGFGDAVTPAPRTANIPSFLNLPEPVMNIYPVYTVLAEKFQAMVVLGFANSRIKDFYDILIISSEMELDGRLLQEALEATFERRGTVINNDQLVVFSDKFMMNEDKQIQWHAFLSKNRLDSNRTFLEVMVQLKSFLEPIYEIISSKQHALLYWSPEAWQWTTAPCKR